MRKDCGLGVLFSSHSDRDYYRHCNPLVHRPWQPHIHKHNHLFHPHFRNFLGIRIPKSPLESSPPLFRMHMACQPQTPAK